MISGTDRKDLIAKLAATPTGVAITCASPSMEPTIRAGDTVRVRRVERVRAGDVVVFETADGAALMLHRVVLALPNVPWIAHLGDASRPRATALFHRDRLIGVADVPKRPPRTAAVVMALARLARRGVGAAISTVKR